LFLFAGCATFGGDSDGARNSWQGAAYAEVVSQWGAPSRSTTLLDGRQVHTWVAEGGSSGGFPASIGIFGGSGGGGVGGSVIFGGGELQRCERTLTFQNDRVVEQTWLGPASFCSTFARG